MYQTHQTLKARGGEVSRKSSASCGLMPLAISASHRFTSCKAQTTILKFDYPTTMHLSLSWVHHTVGPPQLRQCRQIQRTMITKQRLQMHVDMARQMIENNSARHTDTNLNEPITVLHGLPSIRLLFLTISFLRQIKSTPELV